MQQRNGKLRPPAAIDRRSGRDRRLDDKGAAGGRDRRVGIEPRRPEVVELELTPAEWAALHGAAPDAPAEALAERRPDPPAR